MTARDEFGSGGAPFSEPHWPLLVQCAPREVRAQRAPRRDVDCGLARGLHSSYCMSRERSIHAVLAAAAVVTLLWVIPTAASAGSVGRTLFNTYCAACHGADARGNGPVAGVLRIQPPDLTGLTRRFGMPLHRDKVAEYIDGRIDVLAHGPRDMPVWGNRLRDELIGQPATEDTIRRTIDAIVEYLVSIQEVRGAVR